MAEGLTKSQAVLFTTTQAAQRHGFLKALSDEMASLHLDERTTVDIHDASLSVNFDETLHAKKGENARQLSVHLLLINAKQFLMPCTKHVSRVNAFHTSAHLTS